ERRRDRCAAGSAVLVENLSDEQAHLWRVPQDLFGDGRAVAVPIQFRIEATDRAVCTSAKAAGRGHRRRLSRTDAAVDDADQGPQATDSSRHATIEPPSRLRI